MPQFDFKAPDGNTYSIAGPEGATPQQAFAILQQHLGGSALVGRPQSSGGEWWKGDPPADQWKDFRSDPVFNPSEFAAFKSGNAVRPGYTLDQPVHSPAASACADAWNVVSATPAPSVAVDAAKSGGIGLAKGAIGLAGLPGAINNLMARGGEWVGDKLGLPPLPQGTKFSPDLPTPQSIQSGIEGVTGKFCEPQTTPGKYAQTIGEFAPAMIGGPEGLLSRFVTRAAIPGTASEAAGQATEGTAAEPWARAIGGVAGSVPGLLRASGSLARAEVPTAAELKSAAQAGYRAPEVAAVEIKPQAVTNLSMQIENDLLQRGFRPTAKSAGDTFGEIRDLQVPRGVQSVKVADLDTARQALGNLSKEVDAIGQPTAEAAAAQRAISHIDDFLPNLSQADLLAGDAAKANSILQEARANYRAYKQSSLVDTKQANAELQAASTYGGGNINNATRQAFRPLLRNNEAGLSGFSPEAAAQANQVVVGGPLGNTMRQIGRLAPTGPVNMGLHVGAALGTGGATIPIAIGAYAAKKVGEAITRSEVSKLNEIVRTQSPLYAQRAGQAALSNALVPASQATAPTPVLLRALLLGMQGRPPRSPLYAQGNN